MNRFEIFSLPLEGLKLVERLTIGDSRGSFSRLFCADELKSAGWAEGVSQINHTWTALRGTVRGMHFQVPPHAETKLIHCIRGAIWDVAVDVRADSQTFLSWHAEELSAQNRRALLIPKGFAHGFQALTDNVELVYVHTAPYAPDYESGLHPEDPALEISWPLPVSGLSSRDSRHPCIGQGFGGLNT